MGPQKMIKFNVKAISNGFILDATYLKDTSGPNSYENYRFEKRYFSQVDVMCDFIKEYFVQPAG